ncbi:hypothetical protein ACIOC1_04395 [Streptomyces sp. NPDC088197]|uniref:hypothetical protein n=1 Tax=Streptomyces sp. NPDC088197 TaxID=3365840 RepID=UPI00381332A6
MFLGEVPGDDASALDGLRKQAAAESDPTALQAQLLALGSLSAHGAVTDASWFRPWLTHPDPLVRLAAIRAALPTATTSAAARGLGGTAGSAFVAFGAASLPDVPWGSQGREAVRGFAEPLRAQPREARELVGALTGAPRADLRRAALVAADAQLRYWRRPSAGLWEAVVAGLDDEDRVRAQALDILAGGGAAVTPYADRLARFVQEQDRAATSTSTVDLAVRALMGAADDRALPRYRERFGSHYLRGEPPPLRWAPHLLPAFRERLRGGPGARGIPEVLNALTAWGPSAVPATPELAGLLDTTYAGPAADALGRIGPAARTAGGEAVADLLAGLARGDLRPPRGADGIGCVPPPASQGWHGAQTAAWAHWRVTGDPELALRVIGAAALAGLGRPALARLADLGSLAFRYADAVRPLLGCPGAWSRLGAAEAWWRLTGDAATAVDTLLPELRPLAAYEVTPLVLRTVQALGRIGSPAAAAAPTLRVVLDADRRYGGGILLDEQICRAATEALDRIG